MKIYDYNGKKNICGERVRLARQMRKMSQSDLAAKLQVENVIIERDSVSRIEAGTRFVTDYELKVLSKVLRVSIMWLIDEEELTV
ncbi:MAG: helix-turn-helix transcriptional regulator [Clostridia bacterium]|nr:helix-turn-helix transcriptional regulator [Clostridia bacterium]